MAIDDYPPQQEILDRLERIRVLLTRAWEVRAAIAAGGAGTSGPSQASSRALERFLHENVEAAFVPRSPQVDATLAAIEAHIAARTAGRETPFLRLVRVLGLDEIEVDLLLATLAPGMRRAFREGLQLLGPEIAPGVHPAAHLLELVAGSVEAFARGRAAVTDDGRLIAEGALLVGEVTPLAPPLWRALGPSETVLRWLDGRPSAEPTLDPPQARPLGALIDPSLAARLEALLNETRPRPLRVVLVGEAGAGRTRAAAALATRLGCEAAVLTPRREDAAREPLLDARLRARLLFVPAGSDALDASLIARLARLARLDIPCVVAATPKHPSIAALQAAGFARVAVSAPSTALQIHAWRLGLGPGDVLSDEELGELVRGHTLDLRTIEAAAAEARSEIAGTISAGDSRALLAAAERSARDAISHRLSEVADRLSTTLTWDDLVLPDDVRAAVDEVWQAAAARRTVYEKWGFELRTPYGRAISALFGGDPGTGKTMVATLIARQLGLELYRVDLSRLVDKYVGETEKHLATLFAEAERGRCAILFDEADALFGKRTSEGKSSTERYSNMEINYLLQRIETFSGIAILTTNQESVMDTAFKRRIRYHVHFPFPTLDERQRLWRRLLPNEAPLAPDVDLKALARRYEISGGHIKSAVLRAAYAAAAANDVITQARLVRAADQELENMGKLIAR